MTDPQSVSADAAPSPGGSGHKTYEIIDVSGPGPIPPLGHQPPPKPQDLFGGIVPRSPRGSRKPAGPPTRDRKLKAVSQKQIDAARALVKAQPPIKAGPKIAFEPDDTPADADETLSKIDAVAPRVKRPWTDGAPAPEAAMTTPAKHPGPLPASASAAEQEQRDRINAVRAEISPYPPMPPEALRASEQARSSAELSDVELQQMIQVAQAKYGPILSLDQAAEVSKLAKQTIHDKLGKEFFGKSVARGRPTRFLTHRFLQEIFRS